MDSYKNKYLKYKSKYLQLKEQIGSADTRYLTSSNNARSQLLNLPEMVSSYMFNNVNFDEIKKLTNLDKKTYNNVFVNIEMPVNLKNLVIKSRNDLQVLGKIGIPLGPLEQRSYNGKKFNIENLIIKMQITDNTLNSILTRINNNYLQSLNLVSCSKITDNGLGYLSVLTNLKSLDLSSCNQITN